MTISALFAVLLFVLGYLVSPITLVWGWIRFTNQPWPRRVLPTLTLGGFALATASAILAIGSAIYAQFHHFPFYDPLLMKIFRTGLLLSFSGLLLGIGGLWQPSSLRWHAPVSAFATASFWVMAAAGE